MPLIITSKERWNQTPKKHVVTTKHATRGAVDLSGARKVQNEAYDWALGVMETNPGLALRALAGKDSLWKHLSRARARGKVDSSTPLALQRAASAQAHPIFNLREAHLQERVEMALAEQDEDVTARHIKRVGKPVRAFETYRRSHPSNQGRRRAVTVLSGIRRRGNRRFHIPGVGVVKVVDDVHHTTSAGQLVERNGETFLHLAGWAETSRSEGPGGSSHRTRQRGAPNAHGRRRRSVPTPRYERSGRNGAEERPPPRKMLHQRVASMEEAEEEREQAPTQGAPDPRGVGAPHREGPLASEQRHRTRRPRTRQHESQRQRHGIGAGKASRGEARTQPQPGEGPPRAIPSHHPPPMCARRHLVRRSPPRRHLHHLPRLRTPRPEEPERRKVPLHQMRHADPRRPECGHQPAPPRDDMPSSVPQTQEGGSNGRRGPSSGGATHPKKQAPHRHHRRAPQADPSRPAGWKSHAGRRSP